MELLGLFLSVILGGKGTHFSGFSQNMAHIFHKFWVFT